MAGYGSDGIYEDRVKAHTHRCQMCGHTFNCIGEQERNYDGEPEVVCLSFHMDDHDTCPTCSGRPESEE